MKESSTWNIATLVLSLLFLFLALMFLFLVMLLPSDFGAFLVFFCAFFSFIFSIIRVVNKKKFSWITLVVMLIVMIFFAQYAIDFLKNPFPAPGIPTFIDNNMTVCEKGGGMCKVECDIDSPNGAEFEITSEDCGNETLTCCIILE